MFVLNGVFCKVVWLEMHEFKAVHLSDPEPDLLLEGSVSLEDLGGQSQFGRWVAC